MPPYQIPGVIPTRMSPAAKQWAELAILEACYEADVMQRNDDMQFANSRPGGVQFVFPLGGD